MGTPAISLSTTPLKGGTTLTVCAKGAGPALVLLHGIGGHLGQWHDQVSDLSRDFATFSYDARGYGDSAGPPVTRFADFAEDLLHLLDALGIERALAVGHSMGGRTLIEAALRAPDRFAAVLLSGTQPAFLAHMTQAQSDAYIAKREALFSGDTVSTEAAEWVAADVLPPEAPAAARRALVASFLALRREGYIAALRASVGWDRRAELSRLEMPVEVIGGALDSVCPPEETARLAALIGQSSPTIQEGVGHMGLLEAPEQTSALIRAFAQRHRSRASLIPAGHMDRGTAA